MPRRALFVATVALASAGVAGVVVARRYQRSWGVDPADAVSPLPGDEVVPTAVISDTRSIRIAAPAAAVWPWLTQMGFGRAGWYSCDVIDMKGKSADALLADPPELALGDVVPTHADGGFEVRVLEPGRALVLYMDGDLAAAQAKAAQEAKAAGAERQANLEAAGAFMAAAQPPEFAASWAFVLEPEGDGAACRLIERTRVWYGAGGGLASRLLLPVFGFGVFVMVRRQMLGIRARVERQ